MSTDNEDMSVLFAMPSDFPFDDIARVAAMLEDAQLLVPGYIPPDVGIYDPRHYLYESYVSRLEFVVLPDRNLASRMARVAMGERLDEDRRLAAGLMAFAQCLDLNFDPAIAFHELAHHDGNEVATEELQWFREADEARPQDWLDAALRRTENLRRVSAAPDIARFDLAKPLRRWRRNYVLTLKIAELELQPGSGIDKVVRLLDWMYNDFILGGPALLFASLYFAPSAPRKRMLKHLRSPDRARAVRGVRNAAWDVTHLSDFVRRVEEEGRGTKRFLFATADRALALVASSLIQHADDLDRPESLATQLTAWWPPADAQTIASVFAAYVNQLGDGGRRTNSEVPADYVDNLIAAGERLLGAAAGVP